MTDEINYKTQIEDFRNLKPYYDLVFEIMESLSKASFNRDLLGMTRALRELIINVSPYIVDPKTRLKTLETELEKVLIPDYWKGNDLTKTQQEKLELLKDDFFKYVHGLRIEIIQELEKSGFMPKMEKSRQKNQSEKTKGASI